jgi:hypothetical protein
MPPTCYHSTLTFVVWDSQGLQYFIFGQKEGSYPRLPQQNIIPPLASAYGIVGFALQVLDDRVLYRGIHEIWERAYKKYTAPRITNTKNNTTTQSGLKSSIVSLISLLLITLPSSSRCFACPSSVLPQLMV